VSRGVKWIGRGGLRFLIGSPVVSRRFGLLVSWGSVVQRWCGCWWRGGGPTGQGQIPGMISICVRRRSTTARCPVIGRRSDGGFWRSMQP
jgi:hypothetical protein